MPNSHCPPDTTRQCCLCCVNWTIAINVFRLQFSVGNGLELSRIQFTPQRQTDTDGTVLSGLAWRCELGVNVTIESVLTSDQKVDDVVNGAACVADTLVLASVDVSRIAKPNCLVALIEVSAHSALFTDTSEHIRFSLYSSCSPLLVFRAVD